MSQEQVEDKTYGAWLVKNIQIVSKLNKKFTNLQSFIQMIAYLEMTFRGELVDIHETVYRLNPTLLGG